MDPVVVLDAEMSVAAARSAISLAGAREMVIVRRPDPRTPGAVLWYSLGPDDRDRVLGPTVDDRMPLGISLDLHEHGADKVRQLDDADVVDGHWTGLVIDGGRPVGWMWGVAPEQDRGPTRGIDFGARLPMAPSPDAAPEPTRGIDFAEPPPMAADADAEAPPAAAPATESVQAFPRVDVPETVPPSATFDVVVGLSQQAQPGVQGAKMIIAVPADHSTSHLTLQIKAENFTVAQVRQDLPFDPSDIAAHTAHFKLTAPAVTEPWQGRIEVEYSQNGLLIGTAWREILVARTPPRRHPPRPRVVRWRSTSTRRCRST